MLVFLLSGPAGVGKDHIKKLIVDYFGTSVISTFAFADFPKLELANEKKIDISNFYNRILKDSHNMELNNTPRNALIEYSEAKKKIYGQDYWANLVMEKLKICKNPVVVISDCRFESEIDSFIGKFEVVLIKISRESITTTDTYIDYSKYDHINIVNRENQTPDFLLRLMKILITNTKQ